MNEKTEPFYEADSLAMENKNREPTPLEVAE